MDGHYIEPRQVMWAIAEITWEGDGGTSFRVPAILEDTSQSGACIRIKRPLAIGSRLTIKWHREHFFAVARNCRRDGLDFLLGVRREAGFHSSEKIETAPQSGEFRPGPQIPTAPSNSVTPPPAAASSLTRVSRSADEIPGPLPSTQKPRPPTEMIAAPQLPAASHTQGAVDRPERNVMEPKTIFPHFWRRKPESTEDENAPAKPTKMEASVNKFSTPEPTPSGPHGELLGYEDIYRAAGIISPGSGYGIHKVVDMLNNERLRDLSKDAKRASVLMALDAAGISADDLLTDATRRQNALTAYESSQVKQLEDFEARKAKENAKIQEEMEKVRMHYAERVQANLDQVAKEKEVLRNWQMAMQHETQRIVEVIELCGKQAVPAQKPSAMAAAAGGQAGDKSLSESTSPGNAASTRPFHGGN